MIRTFMLLTFIIVCTGFAFGLGASTPDGKDPGALAQQYYRTAIAGNPGQMPAGTEAISNKFFTGAAAGDFFGHSVACAGDVNGDGYSDVIIGAPSNDAGGTGAGRAYVYFGGPGMDNAADVTLTGAVAGDYFGTSIACAGDVNGDGYSDVIVGAYSNDAGGTSAGRAYIYFGGIGMDNAADVTLTGATAGDYFGWSVAGAGDVNGDGYSDVIVGAYYNDAGGSSAGRAYIYFGGAGMDKAEDVTLTGGAAGDYFGWSVAGAGDVNGDGYSDVIVGAYGNDAGGTSAGRAYVYFGGQAMDSGADLTMTGSAPSDYFGYSAAGAGDVNGDGYSDLIVGAYLNDAGGVNAGSAYVYFGGPGMDNIADVVLTGAETGDSFGNSVAGAGDVNGDGYGDVIVGAIDNDAGGTSAGRVFVYFGRAGMDNVADVMLTGVAASDNFGTSVAGAGDVNGDGYGDMIVGALNNDAGGTNAGRAYLYLNSLTGNDIADEFFTGVAGGDLFGSSVACAGDVNGDGYDDMIVGGYSHNAGGTDVGQAYIFFGGPEMDDTADVIFTGAASGDYFGYSVACAGDVNGDGYSDVIVGAYRNDAAGVDAGRAYIYFGGPGMDNIVDVTLTGEAAGDYFGCSVAGAGDVNGDGYSDVIVGAYKYDDVGATDAGRAYTYFGGASMNSTADVIFTGDAAGDRFGYSVAGAGDLNGDGCSDVIVGAPLNDAGGTSAGSAYIYFCGPALDIIADVTLIGTAAADDFGNSVASAGDVNGDGYGDVIVGAPGNDTDGANAGRAYVYLGGPGMNSIADASLPGAAAVDRFGFSVAGAGDLNGDGYSDVIVGASMNNAAGLFAGRAYIYFGGTSMDAIADIILTGAEPGDECGYSVASAGDVNGDGYGDVFVGAPYNDAGGVDAGRAYLFLSSAPPIIPRITSVRDVPNDQGGKVILRWIRSGYDAKGTTRVTSYTVQRSVPPGLTGFAWETVGSMAATQDQQYAYAASTMYDSMSNVSGTFFFRIMARTTSLAEYWKSAPMAGHSADNLAPAGIGSLNASLQGTASVQLHWPANTRDADLGGYVLYRATSSGFVPADSNRIAILSDTAFVDALLPAGPAVYYRVQAKDIHGNLGTASPQAAVPLAYAHTYAVAASWNMTSVPLSVTDFSKAALYPSAVSEAFAYSAEYSAKDPLANGAGYWLKFSSAQNVTLTGIGLTSLTIPVKAGWNMIGSIGVSVPVSQVTSVPPEMVVSPFYTYRSGYAEEAAIEPHRGYWVKVTQDGQLQLNASGSESGAVQIVKTSDMPPDPPFLTSVAKEELPTEFRLGQNYPNPFNPSTVISWQLPAGSHVRLGVYDLLGREVAVLVNELRDAGRHQVAFDGSGLASGVYVYRLNAGSFTETRKMVLAR